MAIYAIISPARTFSSLVAGLLHHAGVSMNLGSAVNPPDACNPRGFYEAMWVLQLNDAILRALGTSMLASVPPVDAVKALVDTQWTDTIKQTLADAQEGAARLGVEDWGFKDGRIGWLIPLWAGPLLECQARIITIDRPADAVIASMMDAWPDTFFWKDDAEAVYRAARERTDALLEGWPHPTLRVCGDALFDDTAAECARLAEFVGRDVDQGLVDPAGRRHGLTGAVE